jgi:ABC-2 type transport system ATP-binding protein
VTEDGDTGCGLQGNCALWVRGLTKRFGATAALDAIDLEVPEGSVFAFLGPNGAGKTTTLRIVAGLAKPTGGEARIFGHAAGSNAARSQVGYLPDVPAFYEWMTAEEYLRFVGGLFSLDRATLGDRVQSLLAMAGLLDVDARIGGYSRGMRQRLGIAQALINAPRLLLLDEPTSALDPLGRREVLEMIAALRGRTTVFFSTHILGDAERVCDTVAILDRGHVIEQAPMEALKARYSANLIIEVDREAHALVRDIRQQPWCVEAHVREQVITMTVSDRDAAQRAVPEMVAARRLGLVRFESAEVSLEDVFVELVSHVEVAR